MYYDHTNLNKIKKDLNLHRMNLPHSAIEEIRRSDKIRRILTEGDRARKTVEDILNSPIDKALQAINNNSFHHLKKGLQSECYRFIADQIKKSQWFKEQQEILANAPSVRFETIGVVVPGIKRPEHVSEQDDAHLNGDEGDHKPDGLTGSSLTPDTRGINDGKQEKIISVMMPFKAELDQTYRAIIDAVKLLGMEMQCLRADSGNAAKPGFMLRNIVDLIVAAKLVVFDLTGYNPNVMYEAGIAHAHEKQVVFISQQVDDLPTDIRHNFVLKYLPNKEGFQKLTEDLAQLMRNALR